MRVRIIAASIVLLLLTVAKTSYPTLANTIRSFLFPASYQEGDYGDLAVSLGKKISLGDKVIYVWDNKTPFSQTEAPANSKPDVSDAFPAKEMVKANLSSFYADMAPSEEDSALYTAQEMPNASQTSSEVNPDSSSLEESTNNSADSSSAGNTIDEKKQAFLKVQETFAEYAVPANVSYNIVRIPFEYAAPASCAVSSHFGYRVHPIKGDVRFHYGTDFGLLEGEKISAFADGTVISVANLSGYGLTVLLQHEDGFVTLYAHCSSISVNDGQSVSMGDVIALAGSTGNVTGPHLHFEIIKDNFYLNPEFYL